MRAVVVRRYGGPEVLVTEDWPEPEPGPGQVVVEVDYANTTFIDTRMRAGTVPFEGGNPALPAILGSGVGGHLDGTSVIAATGLGGYAERVAVDAERLIAVPEGVMLPDAVALLADGRTATALMRTAAVQPGDVVLVEAAAGGVGSLLVQLANAAGAEVVAAAGSGRKLEVARELGADMGVDYTVEGWADDVRERYGNVDVVFDGVGDAVGAAAFELLSAGGRMCSYGLSGGRFGPVSPDLARERGVSLTLGVGAAPAEMIGLINEALHQAAAGRLRPLIGQVFALGQAAEAHRAIESRETVGKTLLRV